MDQEAGIAAAMDRFRAKVVREDRFECAGCAKIMEAQLLSSIGLYVPNETVLTEAGEKKRLIVYPVCKICIQLPPKELACAAERNINLAGMMLDPKYHPPE